MILFATVDGTLIGLIIGLVGAWRGRVVAAVIATTARTVIVWAASITHLQLLAPHRGHHTHQYQRVHAALADTQQWPAVTP